MMIITPHEAKHRSASSVGGKALGLCRLADLGCRIPPWIVLPAETLEQLLVGQPELTLTGPSAIELPDIPDDLIRMITNDLGQGIFAVRSSATEEDGTELSFAGQFESKLCVSSAQLGTAIKQVWSSAFTDRVTSYRKHHGLSRKFSVAVIVQVMIEPDASGVAFSIDPSTGNRGVKLITAVYGLGEGLVTGGLDSDLYHVSDDGNIKTTIAGKTKMVTRDRKTGTGTAWSDVEPHRVNVPALEGRHVMELSHLLHKAFIETGKYQDIEFAVKSGDLFVLQMRPIVRLDQSPDTTSGYIVWDNSNIIESYPGVTTPLTFSFVRSSYEAAYKLFSQYLGVSKRAIARNSRVYANTLGLINGRIYYNLKNWYHMLAMLPGYSLNARYMETMMGVKERFDIPPEYRLSRATAWMSLLKMAIQMYARYLRLPASKKRFYAALSIIDEYRRIDLEKRSVHELIALYLRFESRLLAEWKAPLLNDFFAMIWFGRLKKQCAAIPGLNSPNIHNDLLCGSNDIISIAPVHRCIKIAALINGNPEWRKLFEDENDQAVLVAIRTNKNHEPLLAAIEEYLSDYGERCVGELKLESISYTQAPSKFIAVLRGYVSSGMVSLHQEKNADIEIRKRAEQDLRKALKNSPLRRFRLWRTLKKTRELVTARENLRYERTRAFGVVRSIFTQAGRLLYAEGVLRDPQHIFYLTKEEIFSYVEGTSVNQDIAALTALRIAEFNKYKTMPQPPERFASYGLVYHCGDYERFARMDPVDGNLSGIGCCPGRVKGTVRVVHDPGEVRSLNGDILVTSSTDPGWVTLFPGASAIIVERGSLLSHSAIVAREMGKPCIVSVTGLLRSLSTGDEIEMDGATGSIKIVKKVG